MGHAADGPGENLRGVGAGVEGESQDRAVHRIAKERIEHRLFTHGGNAVDAGVADQQLDIERRATEQVGVELHRPAYQRVARYTGDGQRDRDHKADDQGGTEQPHGHGQAGDVLAVAIKEGAPVFLQEFDHRTASREPAE